MRPAAIITGGAGFLGSHLVDYVRMMGMVPVIYDNYMTGRRENYEHVFSEPRKQSDAGLPILYERNQDVINIDPEFVVKNMLDLDLDVRYVFNFACPASPPKYQLDPVHTMMTSVVGTKNMLEVAKLLGARFVQASTSEIYGNPDVHPQPESYKGCVNTTGPRACYDEGKRAAESLCYDYARAGLYVRVVRIFNTYGPRMDPADGRVVTNFINQALRGEDITIYGDGKQTRSFCYVDDLISGIMSVASASKLTGPEARVVMPFNVGNPGEFTMLELAEKVIEKTGSKSKIDFMPLPQDDPERRRPDITRIQEWTQWRPLVNLDEGLERTIKYFKENRK